MLRGKLAEEGMLKEDICLGTKATTQRSDTWGDKGKTRLGFIFINSKLEAEINQGWKIINRLKSKDPKNYDSEALNVSRGPLSLRTLQ